MPTKIWNEKVLERTAEFTAGESRFHRLVDLSADAIILCDADRSIQYANPAAQTLVKGGAEQSLNGLAVDSIFFGEEVQWIRQWLASLVDSPQQHALRDAVLVSEGGKKIPVQLSLVSYADQDRIRAQIVLHDMTQLRANEIAVKEQLRFIDQLLEAIPLPLSVRDERGRYLRINRAYEMAYNCKRYEISQRSVFDVLPYELAKLVAQRDQAAMLGLQAVVYEKHVGSPDSAGCDFLVRASAIRRFDGSVIGVIAVDTDVTEIRQKESQLRGMNAELEALSQQLIASQENERRRIARDLHDQVGQILTALKMSLETIAAGELPVSPAMRRSLELAEEALNHTRSLTASLHPHILEDLGLAAAVRQQLEKFVQPQLQNVQVSIKLDPPRGIPANELVAFRVMQESLTNVVRHASASRLKVMLEALEGSLHIAVADDGDGFETNQSRFDTRRPTSLGIASMRERVAEVGGQFTIESEEGEGTVVRAVLPW